MKKIFLLIIIIIIFVIVFFNKKNIYDVLDDTNDIVAYIDKYFIYGTHLNIYGNIDLNDDIDNAYIVLKNNNEELEYNIDYNTKNNKLEFKTAEYINDGIYLDDINIGEYIILLKIINNEKINYYTLKNNTEYNNLDYYTITKNNKNNMINIKFDNNKEKDFLYMNVTESKNDYYDIVIDAGHGGDDPGAIYNNHNESDITLDYAVSLKEKLEEIGLKVKLSREDDITINSYGKNSRTSIPHEVKAKYIFSIHLNSCEDINSGGVEIYAPNNANLNLAKSLAFNIKEEAKTKYSLNEANKVSNGVYVRTFTKEEITESVTEAKKNGYNPYNINIQTNYYFIIRENGGFITGAYVDGRNKNYNKNEYYNTNIGVEGYLLELGYINYQQDLNNLLNNKKGYIDGIVKALKEELNI